MATVTIDLPDDAFAALRRSPKEFSEGSGGGTPGEGWCGPRRMKG
jgi:hypothetical protein